MLKGIVMHILTAILFVVVILLVAIVSISHSDFGSQNYELTKENCCDGYDCTDTYWDSDAQECKYVFEERNSMLAWIPTIAVVAVASLVLCFLVMLIPKMNATSNLIRYILIVIITSFLYTY